MVLFKLDTIFNFIGGIFGYVLWSAFYLTKNYGIATNLYLAIAVKVLLLFPFSVKQQKAMASNARFQANRRKLWLNIRMTA